MKRFLVDSRPVPLYLRGRPNPAEASVAVIQPQRNNDIDVPREPGIDRWYGLGGTCWCLGDPLIPPKAKSYHGRFEMVLLVARVRVV